MQATKQDKATKQTAAKVPSTQTQPAATPTPAVALRGGAAVATVQVKAGAVYRTKAPHNQQWWATVVMACAATPVPVATLCAALPTGHAVPSHFVGYCLRRGYLVGA